MKSAHKPIPFHKYEPTVPKKEGKKKYKGLHKNDVELILDINKGLHHGYHKSCEGKVRFTNRKACNRSVMKYKDYHPEPKHSYLCPYCGHWHIGSDRDPQNKYDYPLKISWEIINQLKIDPSHKDRLETVLGQMKHQEGK